MNTNGHNEIIIVKIKYKNWEGKVKEYTIKPDHVWMGATTYHPDVQLLLKAEKWVAGVPRGCGEIRDFAVRDILEIEGEKIIQRQGNSGHQDSGKDVLKRNFRPLSVEEVATKILTWNGKDNAAD